jgi:hypothetical protein
MNVTTKVKNSMKIDGNGNFTVHAIKLKKRKTLKHNGDSTTVITRLW